MLVKNNKISLKGISVVIAGILLLTMFPVVGSVSAGVKNSGVKIVNPVYGPVKLKGADAGLYHYKAKITADKAASLIFKQDSCVLSDKKGNKHSKCWIHISGASAGLSFTQRAPINMKTFDVELEEGGSSNVVRWDSSMVDGADGALEFRIPKDGFVIISFLWEVPKGFSPSRVKIGDVINVAVKK